MSEKRSSFPTLELGDQAGQALTAKIQGESAAAAYGSVGFAYKDSSGNVVLPTLTPQGRVPVDSEANNGSWLSNRGEDSDGSVSGTFSTIASINLSNDDIVDEFNYAVSGRKGGLFQVCLDDDGVISVLEDIVLESGHYTHSASVKTEVTAGSTGTQKILIRAHNWETVLANASALRASLRALIRSS